MTTRSACFEVKDNRFAPQKGERLQVPCKKCGFPYGVYKAMSRSYHRIICPKCKCHTGGGRGWHQQAMRWVCGEVKI